MTTNMHNGPPRGRREHDRERDAGRRSEATGARPSLNTASMNLGRHPLPNELFRAHSFEDSRREWLSHVPRAADLFSDEEILAMSKDWATQLVEGLVVEPLVLPRCGCDGLTTRRRRSPRHLFGHGQDRMALFDHQDPHVSRSLLGGWFGPIGW
jgi:hypothetical protein